MKTKYLFTAACLIGALLCPPGTRAQCGGEKPTWATGSYHESLNNSYLETVKITGNSYEDASEKADREIQRRRKTTVGEQDAWIKSKLIADYWEECSNGRYTGYFLFQTNKNPNPKYKLEDIVVTDQYPFSPRVFVPGMAQLHKGSTGKGIFFIMGEVALIGGVVACEGLRASYESKISATRNPAERQTYISNADNMQNIRNGLIAGAAALYIWNIIDGAAAKGKKHVQIFGKADMNISPFVTADMGSGISLTLNF
jgi:hypothetical protein